MAFRNPHVWLGIVVVSALAVRVGWGLGQGDVDERLPDQMEYLELARNFRAGEGMWLYDERFNQHVAAFRTPGYPFFIALWDASPRAVRVVQAVLDASTVLAVYVLARRWLGEGVSVLAAVAVAMNPFLVYFSGLLLSETLFTAMLAWGMVLLAWRPNALWGGLVLALSVLVRPSAALLPVVLGVAGAFVHHVPGEVTRRSWWRVPVASMTLLLVILTLLPWALRNKSVLGEWVWLTTNGGITKYDGFNPEATGASNQQFATSPEMLRLSRMTETERDEYLSGLANAWITRTWEERPGQLIRLTLSKLGRTWSPIPLSEEFGGRVLYLVVALLYSIPFYALLVMGLWKGEVPQAGKAFLVAPAAYLSVVHALSVGSLRYRVPVEPILAVLAAAGARVAWNQGRMLAAAAAARQWTRRVNRMGVGIVSDSEPSAARDSAG